MAVTLAHAHSPAHSPTLARTRTQLTSTLILGSPSTPSVHPTYVALLYGGRKGEGRSAAPVRNRFVSGPCGPTSSSYVAVGFFLSPSAGHRRTSNWGQPTNSIAVCSEGVKAVLTRAPMAEQPLR